MRILHIINSLVTSGAERLIVETSTSMVSKGYEVDVLLLNNEKFPFYYELEKRKCCNIFTLGSTIYNPLYAFKIIPYLKKGYDIIHVHLFPALYVTACAKAISFSAVPLIFTEHNTTNRRMESKWLKWIDKIIYKRYRKIICITDEVKQSLSEKLKIRDDKLKVIYNGINIEDINCTLAKNRNDFGYNKDDIILIMVAAFREQKDQDTLIKTVKELPEKYKLLLVGGGERREILENLVKNMNLEDRVQFTGVRSDVFALTKMSDIAVISSHWEGFGLVAAEAMASGIPVIASNVDGLAQVVGDNGLLFENGCVEDLRNKIISLENINSYEHYVQLGLKRAADFSIEKMVNKTLDFYESLLSNN